MKGGLRVAIPAALGQSPKVVAARSDAPEYHKRTYSSLRATEIAIHPAFDHQGNHHPANSLTQAALKEIIFSNLEHFIRLFNVVLFVYTPAITSGLSFTALWFHVSVSLCSTIIEALIVSQMLRRIRVLLDCRLDLFISMDSISSLKAKSIAARNTLDYASRTGLLSKFFELDHSPPSTTLGFFKFGLSDIATSLLLDFRYECYSIAWTDLLFEAILRSGCSLSIFPRRASICPFTELAITHYPLANVLFAQLDDDKVRSDIVRYCQAIRNKNFGSAITKRILAEETSPNFRPALDKALLLARIGIASHIIPAAWDLVDVPFVGVCSTPKAKAFLRIFFALFGPCLADILFTPQRRILLATNFVARAFKIASSRGNILKRFNTGKTVAPPPTDDDEDDDSSDEDGVRVEFIDDDDDVRTEGSTEEDEDEAAGLAVDDGDDGDDGPSDDESDRPVAPIGAPAAAPVDLIAPLDGLTDGVGAIVDTLDPINIGPEIADGGSSPSLPVVTLPARYDATIPSPELLPVWNVLSRHAAGIVDRVADILDASKGHGGGRLGSGLNAARTHLQLATAKPICDKIMNIMRDHPRRDDPERMCHTSTKLKAIRAEIDSNYRLFNLSAPPVERAAPILRVDPGVDAKRESLEARLKLNRQTVTELEPFEKIRYSKGNPKPKHWMDTLKSSRDAIISLEQELAAIALAPQPASSNPEAARIHRRLSAFFNYFVLFFDPKYMLVWQKTASAAKSAYTLVVKDLSAI